MIANDRMAAYLNSLEVENSELLEAIEREARKHNVPVIRKEMQSFLKVLVTMNKPTRILEIGTAVGFSALLMSEYAPKECQITTIEKHAKHIVTARNHFIKAGKERQITLVEGDALGILKGLSGTYDFIFVDAAKGQYIYYLPEMLRLLQVGGVLISDNVLQDGDIIESRYAIDKRNRTIHGRMREYLFKLKHDESLLTSIIPLGDGVTVSIKKEH